MKEYDFKSLSHEKIFEYPYGTEFLLVFMPKTTFSMADTYVGKVVKYEEQKLDFGRISFGIGFKWKTESPLVVTTKIRKNTKDFMGSPLYFRCPVTCLLPLTTGSSFYSDDELFESKITGDYTAIYKDVRSKFIEWKRNN